MSCEYNSVRVEASVIIHPDSNQLWVFIRPSNSESTKMAVFLFHHKELGPQEFVRPWSGAAQSLLGVAILSGAAICSGRAPEFLLVPFTRLR